MRKIIVTSFIVFFGAFPLGAADKTNARLDQLYQDLSTAGPDTAAGIAAEIELELSKSGSPAMDLLRKRGVNALEQGDYLLAVEHLTALTDHAPDFADGWYLRAQAYIVLEQPGPAMGDLERALLLEPRHYNALLQLAALMEDLGYEDLALEAYQQVVGIFPQLTFATDAVTRLQEQLAGKSL